MTNRANPHAHKCYDVPCRHPRSHSAAFSLAARRSCAPTFSTVPTRPAPARPARSQHNNSLSPRPMDRRRPIRPLGVCPSCRSTAGPVPNTRRRRRCRQSPSVPRCPASAARPRRPRGVRCGTIGACPAGTPPYVAPFVRTTPAHRTRSRPPPSARQSCGGVTKRPRLEARILRLPVSARPSPVPLSKSRRTFILNRPRTNTPRSCTTLLSVQRWPASPRNAVFARPRHRM